MIDQSFKLRQTKLFCYTKKRPTPSAVHHSSLILGRFRGQRESLALAMFFAQAADRQVVHSVSQCNKWKQRFADCTASSSVRGEFNLNYGVYAISKPLVTSCEIAVLIPAPEPGYHTLTLPCFAISLGPFRVLPPTLPVRGTASKSGLCFHLGSTVTAVLTSPTPIYCCYWLLQQ